MDFGYTVISAPAEEPVTVSQVKSHLRIDISDDDTLLGLYITAARLIAEDSLKMRLITQTIDITTDVWPGKLYFELPIYPVQSITSVKYYAEDSTEYTLSSANYVVDVTKRPARIVLKNSYTWPSLTLRVANGVIIRAVVGFGAAATVDERIKHGIKLIVGEMYENRENTVIAQGVSISELPNNYRRIFSNRFFRF